MEKIINSFTCTKGLNLLIIRGLNNPNHLHLLIAIKMFLTLKLPNENLIIMHVTEIVTLTSTLLLVIGVMKLTILNTHVTVILTTITHVTRNISVTVTLLI